jgi:hypothetical protein
VILPVRNPKLSTVAAAAFLLLMSPAVAQSTTDEPSLTPPSAPGAVLQGLDKVTARISTFPAATDEEIRFGTLSIRVRACHKTPPTEPPESTAFLEITDTPPGGEPVELFSGWMFASSPALSALEHAVYDVWVVDCMKASSSSEESAD